MITGQLTLQSFRYAVGDGEGNKVVDGKQTDEKVALKILSITDQHSQLQTNYIFTAEEFEQFIATLKGSNIIEASFIPRLETKSPFTRNGGIRG
jgi:hypothetical protein